MEETIDPRLNLLQVSQGECERLSIALLVIQVPTCKDMEISLFNNFGGSGLVLHYDTVMLAYLESNVLSKIFDKLGEEKSVQCKILYETTVVAKPMYAKLIFKALQVPKVVPGKANMTTPGIEDEYIDSTVESIVQFVFTFNKKVQVRHSFETGHFYESVRRRNFKGC